MPLQGDDLPEFTAQADDLAAIIFTTGSTGPPKGVEYTHGIFHTQLRLIRDYFGIGEGGGGKSARLTAAARGDRSGGGSMDHGTRVVFSHWPSFSVPC